jgi:two-component system CheB/CheR fusion protein
MTTKRDPDRNPKHPGPAPEREGPQVGDGAQPACDLAIAPDPGTAFPVVGIGASAGGLAAFEAFFSGMPADADPGMAFVLVQHLAPDHNSILTDLVRRYTRMRVYEVENGMQVEANCAYIIPPNRDMAFLNGTLQLQEPAAPRGQRLPIDFFFRSLARDQRERAICIVLSGSGSDGTQGLRAVKGEGGMAMAQDPDTTDYDGMPRSAIATGLVDYVLPPERMAAQLMAYVAHAFGHPPVTTPAKAPEAENTLKRILILMRTQTGHDFSKYKMNTIHRRIERRMAVHQIQAKDEYAAFLRQNQAEVDALFHDLLIGVTSFFRDPAEFKVLEEQAIPKLFAGKAAGGDVRIWVPGCSTGEEAYSIAILLQERMEILRQPFRVQVFATDIDPNGIVNARTGLYPASIAADLAQERLGRFFTVEPDGSAYRIHKSIRDMLVFSEQDLIRDPPFSKLDLISCRNLLIYMSAELQKKLIPLFHYALNPGGFLFQGTSETIGDYSDLFTAVDRKAKLFLRKDTLLGTRPSELGPVMPQLAQRRGGRFYPEAEGAAFPARPSVRELTEQALFKQMPQSGALVDERGDILYLHGHTGQYLEPAPGEAGINNILNMAREGLRLGLGHALQQAVASRTPVEAGNLRVKTDGNHVKVNVAVRPVKAGGERSEATLYLVVFSQAQEQEDSRADQAPAETGLAPDADLRIEALRQELRAKEDFLKATNEQLETSNEELKSANEEMQSVNEELQSTNEELETSKEELQSVNEELTTVNAELQTKVVDLSRANNDMNNLLAGTGIATIFVDHQLRLLRFTPAATRIINLIHSDVGRPVGHIVSNLVGYDRLVPDLREVLDQLAPKEAEVQTTEGRWYSLRIQLYRTLDNIIEGAVVTFLDISDRKRTEQSLKENMDLFRLLAESMLNLVWTCRPDGIYEYVCPRLADYIGIPGPQNLAFRWIDQVHPEDRARARAAWDQAAEAGLSFQADLRMRHHDGDYRWFQTRMLGLRDGTGQVGKWLGVGVDLTGPGAGAAQEGRDPSPGEGGQEVEHGKPG